MTTTTMTAQSLVGDSRGSHPDDGGVSVDDLSPGRDGRDSKTVPDA